jgi:lysophospholipase
MKIPFVLLSLALHVNAQDPSSDPYVPQNISCPSSGVEVSKADNLSTEERTWRERRLEKVHASLEDYLTNANIPEFNVSDFVRKLPTKDAPVVGLAISGGGTQSGVGGLGVWQALDNRYEPAVKAGTGGVVQLLSYLTGLSGGGFVTVSSLAANNFTSIQELTQAINFTVDYEVGPTGNATEYYTELFENAGAKAELGYPV